MLSKNAKVERIAKVPLFEGCSKADLEKIAGVADEILFDSGRVLIEEGAAGREFILVLEGDVEVRKDGRAIPVSGGFFGEIALLTDRPRTATVTTSSDVRALVITERAFHRLLRDSPQIQGKIMRTLAERLAADAV